MLFVPVNRSDGKLLLAGLSPGERINDVRVSRMELKSIDVITVLSCLVGSDWMLYRTTLADSGRIQKYISLVLQLTMQLYQPLYIL